MYFPSYLIFILAIANQNLKPKKNKQTNKHPRTHTHILYTHILLFFVSFTQMVFFLILSIWKWECCVGYVLMVWNFFFCGNQIGNIKMNVHLYIIPLLPYLCFFMIYWLKCVVKRFRLKFHEISIVNFFFFIQQKNNEAV